MYKLLFLLNQVKQDSEECVKCVKCDGELIREDCRYLNCGDCGHIIQQTESCQEINYNSYKSNYGCNEVQMIGGNSYMRTMVKINSMQKNTDYIIHQELEIYNTNEEFKIPEPLIENIIELYNKVKGCNNKVMRGNNRKGFLGACIYNVFIINGYPKGVKEIAEYIKINNKYISNARRQITGMVASGLLNIEIPNRNDIIHGYLAQYCDILKLQFKQYFPFMTELINVIISGNYECKNSRISTKSMGAIYVVIKSLKIPMKMQDIKRALHNKSKSTFNNFYQNVLYFIKDLAYVFIEYNMPFPDDAKYKPLTTEEFMSIYD